MPWARRAVASGYTGSARGTAKQGGWECRFSSTEAFAEIGVKGGALLIRAGTTVPTRQTDLQRALEGSMPQRTQRR